MNDCFKERWLVQVDTVNKIVYASRIHRRHKHVFEWEFKNLNSDFEIKYTEKPSNEKVKGFMCEECNECLMYCACENNPL